MTVDFSAYPPDLRRIMRNTSRRIDELSRQLAEDEITTIEWLRAMREIIKETYNATYLVGIDSDELPRGARRTIDHLIAIQGDYLRNFGNDIRTNGWLPSYNSRARMYGYSATQSYWEGNIVKQVGTPLPLPRMPAEGTICGSNCKCAWDIRELKGDGNYDCYWRIRSENECQTCVERAAQWNPLRIRDGEVL